VRARPRDLALLAATAGLLAGVVLAVHRASPRSLVSAHGLLHAAIALRAGDGALPPENPFFAGRPLPYYWVFQWMGGQLGAALGTDPLHAFELLIVIGLVALVAAAGALGASLYGVAGSGALLAWLVFAGANVQAPLVLGARLARHGREILADDPTYLWGLVHPVSREMRLGDPFGMYGPLLPFFLNVTARPLALAALVVALAALHRAWRRTAAPTLACVVAAGFALGALGSLVALAATGALAAGIAGLFVFGADAGERRRAALALGALALGVLLAAPTYAHLFGVAGGEAALLGEGLGGAARRAGTLAASAWLPALLAALGLRRAPPGARPFLAVLLVAAGVLALANVALRLPNGNEDNFFHAALVLVTVPAAASALATGARGCRLDAARAALFALVFVPTAALVVGSYLGRAPVPIAAGGGRLLRTGDDPLAALYAWIGAETPRDAVFVLDPGPPIRAFAGNSAELPAFTGRAVFTERPKHYLVRPHPESAARVRAAQALARGEAPAPADEAQVAELAAAGRPVFVLPPDEPDAARDARLTARFGPPVFASGTTRLWRWRPAADAAPAGGPR
jgi:hypothetical protein